jgi:hypothetical protein
VLVVQVLREFAVEEFFFLQVALRKKAKVFFRRATYKVTYVEAVEFRQGWSVSTRRGHEKEKKTTKDGGLSPQEGDVRKKEKKKTKEGVKVAPRRQGSVCPQPRISFLVHEYLGSERPVSLEYRLLRDLVYEEAMCEGSSGNGLPYAAKAVP